MSFSPQKMDGHRRATGARLAGMLYPRRISLVLAVASAVITGGSAGAASLVLNGGKHQIEFNPTNGSIVRVSDGNAKGTLFRSGEQGLWQVRFREGKTLAAAEFQARAAAKHFESRREGNAVLLTYRAPEIAVVVRVTGDDQGFNLQGEISPASNTVLELVLPARLRFDPVHVQRFVSPVHPHLGVGGAFNRHFFEAQPSDRPSAWHSKSSGSAGYTRLYGSGLDMRNLNEPAISLSVTDSGREWLGAKLAERLQKTSAKVSRPSRRTQVDLTLLDSAYGPFLAASRLGGKGALWRFGGQFEERESGLAVTAIEAVIRKLASAPDAHRKIALVSLRNGPDQGSWANASVSRWQEGLERLAKTARLEFVELQSGEQMVAAANGGGFLAILNPYGEMLPVAENAKVTDSVDAIGRYVRGGGNWFEVGGYSFYGAMLPSLYLKYESSYPPVFADFLHLDAVDGRASIYRIQPRPWQPWSAATNHRDLFVPGRLAFAGDEQGGWCERAFGAFVPAGQTWTAPVVRLALGRSAEEDIGAYCQANGITRKLREKMAPPLFEKFRQAVLVKYNGNAQEKLDALNQLPVPTLIHYADYLKGGFDKEYPDHLPPNPKFGTPQQFREFHDRAHALGHLMMPYTNPTWWCDHPRGPSFVAAGEAPLQRNLDGKSTHEQYSVNDGWTTCYWHPAVRAANAKTVREFTKEYPVDILFQDQCGARGWRYDLNPASPTPLAYVEGLLSMIEEDCRTVPLGTEDGWDRVVNAESQLCGFTFALGPGRRQAWQRQMKTVYHPGTWEIYPFVQRIAQDKAALLHHDLGKFVIDRPTLSWTLGLGFSMSYVTACRALNETRPREWLRWLDRVQKSICARYVGEPAGAFEHKQGSEATGDDGVIRATYGAVRLVCNLSPTPRSEAGRELPGYGFYASAPGMIAANLRKLASVDFGEEGISFVSEGRDKRFEVWVYASAGEEVAAELPGLQAGQGELVVDGQPGAPVNIANGVVRFRLPGEAGSAKNVKQLWHATVTLR